MSSKIRTVAAAFSIVLLFVIVSLESCTSRCNVTEEYTYYLPVYTTTAAIRAAAGMQPPHAVEHPGKIYVFNEFLFINESGKGIHVFDNSNPKKPSALSFINLPGNVDMAIKGHTLYADSYVDLVAFDLSDMHNILEVNRMEGLFDNYTNNGVGVDAVQGVVTSWREEKDVEEIQKNCSFLRASPVLMSFRSMAQNDASTASAESGTGGSMARFTITGNYLYALDGGSLKVVDINNESQPVDKNTVTVGWFPETLFPHNDHLFIGDRAGMYIYGLNDPEAPNKIGEYTHVQTCDPVVVEGNFAYVTLYDGDLCHQGINQLEVIDISNLSSPSLLSVYPMNNPHGLGIDNGTLFICDGDAGLKVYDASDPNRITENSLATYPGIQAIDIIPINHIAIVVGADGIFQYDYSDVNNIKILSQIPFSDQ